MVVLSSLEKAAVLDVVEELVASNFDGLAKDGRAGRLSADELRQAVTKYGRTLVSPPPDAWRLVDIYEMDGGQGSFFVEVPIWTVEEGRSDLTLAVRLHRGNDGSIVVFIEDLHVL